MNGLILLASISLHVGDCWRHNKYSGLSSSYGAPDKILEIGDTSVVYTYWDSHISDWSWNHVIASKELIEKQYEGNYEKITCPKGSSKNENF